LALILFSTGMAASATAQGRSEPPRRESARTELAPGGPARPLDGGARAAPRDPGRALERLAPPDLGEWFGPNRLTNTVSLFLLLTVLSLAPAIIIMMTSYVRIIIVLSIARQALGTQSLPPNPVLTTLALAMTFHIMGPVGDRVYREGIRPYSEGRINADTMLARVAAPVREFMARQIDIARNHDDVWLFLDFRGDIDPASIRTFDDVPFTVLLPAYMLSELKTSFIIGFQLFLPFLVIDLAISSILVSMGMLMLPPVLISLPFKLLLFVLVDGWRLIAQLLLLSFGGGPGSAPPG
jgi:flagellar biosynthetic protein FliP